MTTKTKSVVTHKLPGYTMVFDEDDNGDIKKPYYTDKYYKCGIIMF